MQYAREARVKGTAGRPWYVTWRCGRCYAPPAGAALDAW